MKLSYFSASLATLFGILCFNNGAIAAVASEECSFDPVIGRLRTSIPFLLSHRPEQTEPPVLGPEFKVGEEIFRISSLNSIPNYPARDWPRIRTTDPIILNFDEVGQSTNRIFMVHEPEAGLDSFITHSFSLSRALPRQVLPANFEGITYEGEKLTWSQQALDSLFPDIALNLQQTTSLRIGGRAFRLTYLKREKGSEMTYSYPFSVSITDLQPFLTFDSTEGEKDMKKEGKKIYSLEASLIWEKEPQE